MPADLSSNARNQNHVQEQPRRHEGSRSEFCQDFHAGRRRIAAHFRQDGYSNIGTVLAAFPGQQNAGRRPEITFPPPVWLNPQNPLRQCQKRLWRVLRIPPMISPQRRNTAVSRSVRLSSASESARKLLPVGKALGLMKCKVCGGEHQGTICTKFNTIRVLPPATSPRKPAPPKVLALPAAPVTKMQMISSVTKLITGTKARKGRPKVHASAADRQRAFREKRKADPLDKLHKTV